MKSNEKNDKKSLINALKYAIMKVQCILIT